MLMEKESGAVLYEKDARQKLEPASVTKIMTLLLIMEALDSGRIARDDMVTVSAYAAGMGGSQVYLKEGEQMSVSELLKCITVVSGNDAAVAMAEYLSGSEAAFVAEMNLGPVSWAWLTPTSSTAPASPPRATSPPLTTSPSCPGS